MSLEKLALKEVLPIRLAPSMSKAKALMVKEPKIKLQYHVRKT